MEIKMQAPGLIGELDTEGDQRGGNREKRNGGKGKNSGKRWGMETDPPLSAGNVTDEQTESVRRHRSIFRRSGRDHCRGRGHGTVLPQ